MTRVEDLFSEFMHLLYKPGVEPKGVNDIPLVDYVFARIDRHGCIVNFMYSGNYIVIPRLILDLFLSLDVSMGHLIRSEYINGESSISDFIHDFLELITILLIGLSKPDGDRFLSILKELLAFLNVLIFRDWCKEQFSLLIPYIEVKSVLGNMKL